MTSIKDIFNIQKPAAGRSSSKTKSNPPFATTVSPIKPQWNRNKPNRATVRTSAQNIQKVPLPRGKSPGAVKAPGLTGSDVPDGVEFLQSRSRVVQCRNQAIQTDSPEPSLNIHNDGENRIKVTEAEQHSDVNNSHDDLEHEIIEKLSLTNPPKKPQLESNNPKVAVKKRPARYLRRGKEPPTIQDPNCPPGHVALDETERIDMLQKLQASYDTSLQELNRLPICVDTLRVRTRRIELERYLQQTEKNIKLFSKPKVYVELGA